MIGLMDTASITKCDINGYMGHFSYAFLEVT